MAKPMMSNLLWIVVIFLGIFLLVSVLTVKEAFQQQSNRDRQRRRGGQQGGRQGQQGGRQGGMGGRQGGSMGGPGQRRN